MYAVVKSGGRQFRVSEGNLFRVEKLDAKVGSSVTLDSVLMLGNVDAVKIGTPEVKDVSVTCEVLVQGRADKILVFKKKRRHRYQRTFGHRQPFTLLKVTAIKAAGAVSKAKVEAEPVLKRAARKAPSKTGTKKSVVKKTTRKGAVQK